MYWNGHMSTGGWILSVLWTLIIIALVVAAIVWLISALSNRDTRPPAAEGSGRSAREILDRRLASGELTVEQYTELRETIGDPVPAARQTAPPRQRARLMSVRRTPGSIFTDRSLHAHTPARPRAGRDRATTGTWEGEGWGTILEALGVPSSPHPTGSPTPYGRGGHPLEASDALLGPRTRSGASLPVSGSTSHCGGSSRRYETSRATGIRPFRIETSPCSGAKFGALSLIRSRSPAR